MFLLNDKKVQVPHFDHPWYKRLSSLQSCSVSINVCKSVSCQLSKEVQMVKTAEVLGKRMYQTSLKINGSLAFTNNVKGLH